jgi:hypothetical protein
MGSFFLSGGLNGLFGEYPEGWDANLLETESAEYEFMLEAQLD